MPFRESRDPDHSLSSSPKISPRESGQDRFPEAGKWLREERSFKDLKDEEKKKKRKREAGKITDRDRKLFKFTHEQRYLTLAQVARVFWPESKNIYKRPLTRVNQLMASGFLRAEKVRIGEPTLYLLTGRGLKYLKAENLANGLPLVENVDWDNYEHDLWVTDVRIIFEKLGFQWTPERNLKKTSSRRKVPDGIARKDSYLFLIEVERSEKARERYETLFFEQSRQASEGIILYIVKDQRMMASLRKQAQGWPRIYFTTIEELRCREEWALFLNAHGEELVLGELLDPEEDGDWDESLDEFREADQEYRKFQEEAKDKDELNNGGAKNGQTATEPH